jgi:hypothetical protein
MRSRHLSCWRVWLGARAAPRHLRRPQRHLTRLHARLPHPGRPRVRATQRGWTALHFAAQQGYVPVARLLLKRKATPDARALVRAPPHAHAARRSGTRPSRRARRAAPRRRLAPPHTRRQLNARDRMA